jgi:alpha-ketoglutarate-dependent taurine dioxygenase
MRNDEHRPGDAVSTVLGLGDTTVAVLNAPEPGHDLAAWARANQPAVMDALERHGGVLFRGFEMADAEQFEQAALVFADDLSGEEGEHPRASAGGKVYSPVFYPPTERLLWHNEQAFDQHGPSLIWFGCLRPADTGGESLVVDSRAVYRRLDPHLRKPFEEHGIRYVRNYGNGLGRHWRDVFRSADRDIVATHCRAAGYDFEWHGERLRTTCVRPAVIPLKSGEFSWFNQAQHFHTACLDPEIRSAFMAIFDEDELPRSCTYGDGSRIPDDVMMEILAVYEELELSVPLQTAEVLMLNNLTMAHGRGRFAGERRLLVAMGGMADFRDGPF